MFRYPAPTWSPLTSLPGLIAYGDWSMSRFQDANRVTAATVLTNPVYWHGPMNAAAEDGTRPTLATSPLSGQLAVAWNGTSNRPIYMPAPWFAGKAITFFAVYKLPALPAGVTRVFGRGEYNGNGSGIFVGTDGIPRWKLTTSGSSRDRAIGSTDLTGQWVVQAVNYDGTTGRGKVRGQTLDSDALDGNALAFNAADTAAWVGGSTNDGTNFAFYDAKTVALWGVTADVFATDAALTNLVDNLAAYAGIP